MKVLGLDPGLAILGWSVIETQSQGRHQVEFGVIETAAHQALNIRLVSLYNQLETLIQHYKPDTLALETLFFVKNAKTLAMVGHARGVILLSAGQHKLDVFEYAPRQVKLALTGSGAADKKQMQTVLQRLLGLTSLPKPDDAADAVAVGLCHVQSQYSMKKAMATV